MYGKVVSKHPVDPDHSYPPPMYSKHQLQYLSRPTLLWSELSAYYTPFFFLPRLRRGYKKVVSKHPVLTIHARLLSTGGGYNKHRLYSVAALWETLKASIRTATLCNPMTAAGTGGGAD